MGRIIDIFGRRNGRDSYFFYNLFYELYSRFICKIIFTSYVGAYVSALYDPHLFSTVSKKFG